MFSFNYTFAETKLIDNMDFATQPLDLVNNTSCRFLKLLINGKCFFDDFLAEVEKNAIDKKSLAALINLMDEYSPTQMLPSAKFRQIKGVERQDVFEFKKKNLRVYVVMKQPNVYVVLGGYKKGQEKDLKKLKRYIKGFMA